MSGVLVSGATTPLGTTLVHRLVRADIGPVIACGVEPPDRSQLPSAAEYLQVDLTRPRRVRRLLFGPCRDAGISSIVHLAMHRGAHGLDRARRLGVDATRLLLRLAEEHETITRFVHYSSAGVYLTRGDQPDLLREDQPLNLSSSAAPWVRLRVQSDVTVCTRMGLSPSLHTNVLRCAEILAPRMGSQLYDYLGSRVCLRPLGFNPILNLLSLEDAARAFELALTCPEQGVFNIPGADTLPLGKAIRRWGRDDVPVPGPLLGPLYGVRRLLRGTDFSYSVNRRRFHFTGVLDGDRAERVLGYTPQHPIPWPGHT